jgi:hypothetical protein
MLNSTKKTVGTPCTMGFMKNCTHYPQIPHLWLYGYGVHRFRYSVQKADLWYTHDKP